VKDRQAAVEELDGLIKLVNRTWERRAELAPDFTTRQRPTAMGVYKLLPGTKCKQCGQPTCWNFTLKLVATQVMLAACPPLHEPAYADRLAALIVPMPAIG
jgi:ArsR family metal-binding transcriptional regulator